MLKKPQRLVLQRGEGRERTEKTNGQENPELPTHHTPELYSVHNKAKEEATYKVDEESPQGEDEDVLLNPASDDEAKQCSQGATQSDKGNVLHSYSPELLPEDA